jgi:hypothetical protein
LSISWTTKGGVIKNRENPATVEPKCWHLMLRDALCWATSSL